ncbi:MAG: APC family permease [Planctomycetes bacterium]|nr:APC family permease [Planctomycetota bacterium]
MALPELRRVLGPATGVAVCCGMAVGAGILRTPGAIAAQLPDPAWIFGVWLLGALVATLDAFILAEMAAMLPRVGGLVAYVRLSFGRGPAFLVGWSMLLITWPASLAGVAVVTGELLAGGASTLVGEGSTTAGRSYAVALIAAVAGVNLLGLRAGARFEVVSTGLKVLLLAGVCVAAALAAPVAEVVAPPPFPATTNALLAAIGGAMTAVIFSYDGYADAVYLAGETRDPGKALPRALFTALVTITGLYLLANATFLWVLGTGGLAASQFAALDVAARAFGEVGSTVLTVVAVVVLVGAVNGYFLTGPRIGRLLAEEGLALAAFGRVGASGVPVVGTVWIAVAGIGFASTNTFAQLLEFTVPIIAATTALVAIGLLVQRARAPERPRPFRVRWAWAVVGLQVAIGMTLLYSFLCANPWALAIDAGALAVGLCAYLVVRKRAAPAP